MFLSQLGKEEYEIYFHIIIIILLLFLVFRPRIRHKYVNPKLTAQIAAKKSAIKGEPVGRQMMAAKEAEENQQLANAVASQSA